ncbi:anion transporter [Rhodobacter sp. TJ_12]|uniref:SLC13 family permease n=1 Tax=Rhodobacter sp. TJ_12 TaxID=2029399 RepID=UPI001CBA72D0|nr:DASS family sodium-coupled anion symporter [Rhodobacter sp. TJ_12]MBZ4023408.1 anion transporter [Rhodobacter sp. TJ_12]
MTGESPQHQAEEAQRLGPFRSLALILGPLCVIPALTVTAPLGLSPEAWKLVCVAGWMVIWWLAEAIPLPATALVPIVAMPILDIAPISTITAQYGNHLIFLFLGGFLLAGAMQRWGLHRRIALHVVAALGRTPEGIIAGFMLATAFLSMWISNTATAVMMVAVGASVVEVVESESPDKERAHQFGVALMLSIAFSASIGGAGTLIGTPPNALMASLLETGHGIEVGFFRWMLLGVPIVVVMLPLTHWILTRLAFNVRDLDLASVQNVIRAEIAQLGPMSRGEITVAVVFTLTAMAWIFREPLGLPVSDSGIAITAAVVLFALPAGRGQGFVLDWSVAPRLPWGVLILFGGGLALASAFETTGLAAWIGEDVAAVDEVPLSVLVLIVAAVMVFLTGITSNTASAATFLPVLGAVAVGRGIAVEWLMVPVALAASMAFMLPVATPPNAIVFTYKGLKLADMVRAGFVVNLLSIAVIWAAVMGLAPFVFGL